MIDNALKFGMKFDWITPLWTLVQDWRNRPSTGFAVLEDSGRSGIAVRDLLRSKGVKTWGMMFVDDAILFRLRQSQADYARYWMDEWGVPYYGAICKQRKTRKQRRGTR